MIPYGKQSISQDDIDAVTDVLKSDFLTQGPVVPDFEKSVAQYCGAEFAIATNSATSALHIACMSLGVNKYSLVWTSAISFVASANCALYCGASVDFVDVDPETINITPKTLAEKLRHAKANGHALPDVVITVHMAGQSCDMEAIFKLSIEYDFSVIEDASHAIGGRYQGHPVGSCLFSDVTIFSFHPVKIVTSAEGGMALTNSPEIAKSMSLYRSHGVTKDLALMQKSEGPWHYDQVVLGFNYRMTELQAALGLSQMRNLAQFVNNRTAIASGYQHALSGISASLPKTEPFSDPSWHLYILRLDNKKMDRLEAFNRLREKGLGVNVHYRPIYLNSYYQKLGFKAGLCPVAEDYFSRCISIPLFHEMTEESQDKVIKLVKEVCE